MDQNADNPLKYERDDETTTTGISVSVYTDDVAREIADDMDIPVSWVYEAAFVDFCIRYEGKGEPGVTNEQYPRIREIVEKSPRW